MTTGNQVGNGADRWGAFSLAGPPSPPWTPAPSTSRLSAVEWPLAEWHRLYLQLEQARSRLHAERASPGESATVVALQREVDRLEGETAQALAQLNAALRRTGRT